MRNRHEEGLKKSVMLLCALQAMSVVREMHDKSCNYFPDPDIFAFDKFLSPSKWRATARSLSAIFLPQYC